MASFVFNNLDFDLLQAQRAFHALFTLLTIISIHNVDWHLNDQSF